MISVRWRSGNRRAASRTSSFPCCHIADEARAVFAKKIDFAFETREGGIHRCAIGIDSFNDTLLLFNGWEQYPPRLDMPLRDLWHRSAGTPRIPLDLSTAHLRQQLIDKKFRDHSANSHLQPVNQIAKDCLSPWCAYYAYVTHSITRVRPGEQHIPFKDLYACWNLGSRRHRFDSGGIEDAASHGRKRENRPLGLVPTHLRLRQWTPTLLNTC